MSQKKEKFYFKDMLKTFKNYLKSCQAQSIIEYSVIFIAFTLGVVLVFGLQGQRVKKAFDNSVNSSVAEMKK